jgi:hypothetical protein
VGLYSGDDGDGDDGEVSRDGDENNADWLSSDFDFHPKTLVGLQKWA